MIEGFIRYKPDPKASPRPASSYRGARRNAARGIRKARRAAERKHDEELMAKVGY